MGKAYNEEQRLHVKGLLEAGRDEESIEKETGVSDRTIRRWKLELERTGRIGKVRAVKRSTTTSDLDKADNMPQQPPEARTGRHRVLTPDVEQALFEHVKEKPEMSVDDMLWWLYDKYKIVVGTRTIRRVFERKGDKVKMKNTRRKSGTGEDDDDEEDEEEGDTTMDTTAQPQNNAQYQSPYAPMAQQTAQSVEAQMARALQQQQSSPQQSFSTPMNLDADLPEDEETIELQLQQIALAKREVELKLKMRQIQSRKNSSVSASPVSVTKPAPKRQGPSTLYNPNAVIPNVPKRDSRSKKKIEESKKRTAERQERMLRDLERRSRRRDHLTAEWVQSKDIWPLRAQALLADLMHQYQCYAFQQSQLDTFETMYRELYQLVDMNKGDWNAPIHDEMLRERMKRKMGQLRTKMQKTGEIVGRADGYGGFTKADNYTGEQAGAAVGDDNENDIIVEMNTHDLQAQPGAQDMQQQDMQQDMQQDLHQELQQDQQIQYDPLPDHQQMQQVQMSYTHTPMTSQGPGQYPLLDYSQGMMPYGNINTQMSNAGGMGMGL
ncbi:hypothetical protein CLAFUW4_07901 [Fulvia fulva]|nr:hypothetical protein CLAFUR4_07906 [Fulvia fulva]WPV12988.1 hypothetical protein CLAFUW4_07901 [Fulvia fulva]WPV27869.1 hypothetical protein CLAFUW7_07902 [Fulvia fulva]